MYDMLFCCDVFLLASLPSRDELIGPPQKCVACGDEFPFAAIKSHSDECRRYLRFFIYFFMWSLLWKCLFILGLGS